MDVRTDALYEAAGEQAVLAAMEGFHATVFAYGQTASGKTYTMTGSPADPGVIPLAITDVFSYIEECPNREFLLRMTYMEIYNELVHDLLDPRNVNLRIREDKQRGVFVEGLKEQIVTSLDHVISYKRAGDASRHVGRTNYNEVSSRSHTILQLVCWAGPGRPGLWEMCVLHPNLSHPIPSHRAN
jgi:centromeric protein E